MIVQGGKAGGGGGGGTITGSGTLNHLSKFTSASAIGDSNVTDNGSAITISYLAGSGSGFVAVNNSGQLSFSSSAGTAYVFNVALTKGVGDTYTGTATGLTSYFTNAVYFFTFDIAPAAAPFTANLNGLGAVTFKQPNGSTNLAATAVVASVLYEFAYNGTSFVPESKVKINGGGDALSSISAAIATNTIDSLNFAQEWDWSTLSTQTGFLWTANALSSGILFSLTSSSTAATSNTQTLFNIGLSGTNGTSAQTTYGAKISNTHAGTTSTNIALQLTASGGTTANYSLISTAGRVGLNTTTPTFDLHLVGQQFINVNSASVYQLLTLKQSANNNGSYIVWQNDSGTEKGYVLYQNGSAGTRPDEMMFLHAAGGGGMFIDASGRSQFSTTTASTPDTNVTLTVDSITPTGAIVGMSMRRASNTVGSGIPIYFYSYNASNAYALYAYISSGVIANTAGAQTGSFSILTYNANIARESMKILPGASSSTTFYFGNGSGATGDQNLTFQHTGSQTGGASDLPGFVWNLDGAWGSGTAVGGSIMVRICPPAAGSANTANAAVNLVEFLGSGKGVAHYQQATPLTAAAVTDGFVFWSNDFAGAGTATANITNENGSIITLAQNTGWTASTVTTTLKTGLSDASTLGNVLSYLQALENHILGNMKILHS